MIKVLLLFCVVFFLGKAQEVSNEPESTINEKLMQFGPSTIHSIKGKLYEQTQREIDANPKTYNANVTKLEPVVSIGSLLHNTSKNFSNTELPRQGEKVLFRRNFSNTTEPIPQTIISQNPPEFDVPKELQKTQLNNSDSAMLFHVENSVLNYGKNHSIETLKKELAFDSLLIKNDFNNYSTSDRKDIMNSYMHQEINPEADMVHGPFMMQLAGPRRRFETDLNYGPIPHDPFKIPIMDENNIMPITSKFEPTNHGNNVLNNRNTDTTVPLRQNNYNIIDKSTCDDRESDERSGNDIQLVNEPTKGLGISNVGKSRVMLMDHPRVCYACSSITDPSCWTPDRTTAVKYCRADHPSCLTKLYKYKGLSYIIRDCGKTCEQASLGLDYTKYTACTICHHDLCNSVHHFKIQNITILMLLISHLLILLNVSVN